ncbi:MAG: acetate--CoA ligase family protein [Arenicellales bacterium]
MHGLTRCLNPRNLAVVGGKEASRVIQQCRKLGFDGEIWSVNPRRADIEGIACFKDVSELPVAPDVVFIGIPAAPTVEVIRKVVLLGAGGAICYASGFNEVGNASLQKKLIEAAGGMPVIGPNCYGYINALNGAALWPDQHGLRRVDSGVAIFSSSGNLSVNMTMQQRALPVALIVTVGNQAIVGIEHCIEAVLEDERIGAIGIHIEGLQNLEMFTELTCRASEIGKPVVALKSGRSTLGARITMSHTATLAGESRLYDALFNRIGVARVDDLETFLETLKLAFYTGPLAGKRIASMSCSGGEASMIADLTNDMDLEFPQLDPAHAASVQATLNEYVSVENPLDYHTFIWGDQNRLCNTFAAMLKGGFDITLLILDYPCTNDCDMQEWIEAGEAFAHACEQTGQQGAIVCTLTENMPTEVAVSLAARGVVPLLGLSQAVHAIEAVASLGIVEKPIPMFPHKHCDAEKVKGISFSEHQAKQTLAEAGLNVVPGKLVGSEQEALDAAEMIGYPVVLKACGSEIIHKTELDGVVLGVKTPKDVSKHITRLFSIGDQVLVEKMLEGGVAELLIGVNFDSEFGHYLVIGIGGILVELLGDREIVLLPASENQIRDALYRLRSVKLLQGYRGRNEGDIKAVVKTVKKLAEYVSEHKDRLLEVDINPLMVNPKGLGVTILDALIVNRSEIS